MRRNEIKEHQSLEKLTRYISEVEFKWFQEERKGRAKHLSLTLSLCQSLSQMNLSLSDESHDVLHILCMPARLK
jgi:hypothetical protein